MSAGFLLDTNIVSETRRRQPDANVTAFIREADPQSLFLSVITLGELRKGIALKRRHDPAAADSLSTWTDGLEYGFADRILPIDGAITRLWGELAAQRPRPVIDTLLAATALVHGYTLVTRNVADMQDTGVRLLNPFQAQSLP